MGLRALLTHSPSDCGGVPLSLGPMCPYVLVSWCPSVPMSPCPGALCPDVSVSWHPCVPMSLCPCALALQNVRTVCRGACRRCHSNPLHSWLPTGLHTAGGELLSACASGCVMGNSFGFRSKYVLMKRWGEKPRRSCH